MTSAREIVLWFNKNFDPALAEEWDSVGVISGDWNREVAKILFTVDITAEVLDEAISIGAQMIVAHHPLVLPRHSVVSEPYKFQLIARANLAGIFLFNAHTNADNARPGVADALADVLQLVGTDALVPTSDDVSTGTGRIGELREPVSLRDFTVRINQALPNAQAKFAGDPDKVISIVAVCPGSGDSLLPVVRATGADVFVTSDLRHHPVAEHREARGCALIDINHVAAEATWLPMVSAKISEEMSVSAALSAVDTRAWRHN
ncbi:MAG: hypothetical protein RL410_217 [Actinomycetota bacterium]|jgi:dinuclear metal center YbgI/SA1388 family protein